MVSYHTIASHMSGLDDLRTAFDDFIGDNDEASASESPDALLKK